MDNRTNIRVPKKYQPAIKEIFSEGPDGYWVYLNEGFYSPMMETGTIHEWTVANTLAEIRNIAKCEDVGECYCIADNCLKDF